jgi:hypothetical protein
MTAFYLLWAVKSGRGVHSAMPTVAEAEAQGYEVIGGDPRYPDTALMRREVEAES